MKQSWPVFVALFAFSVLGSSGSAEAGFFDFLFGNQQPAPAPAPFYYPPARGYAPSQPMELQYRRKASRKAFREVREVKSRRAARAERQFARTERWPNTVERVYAFVDKPSPEPARDLLATRKLADVARERGFQAAFMEDPTLRSGDILVTQAGIVVFEGRDKTRENNFRPLNRSRLKNRADLALLQKISGFGHPQIALPSTGAMPPLVIQQRGRRSKIDTPSNEPPKVELPKVETPKVETPKAETAKMEPEIANPREAAISQ